MYSEKVHEHVVAHRNVGPPKGATHQGTVGVPGEGTFVRIYLKILDKTIVGAGYNTRGCPAAIASASVLAEMVIGKPVAEAAAIGPQDVVDALGGLPEGKMLRANEAVEALRRALEENEW